MPIVSIVIPNYNYGHFADAFFQSLAQQSFPLDKTEIIFVDDGSDDDSIFQAEKWSHRMHCDRFVIETPRRTGCPGSVRNHGLSIARGKHLLCLDPDDTILPEFISTCVQALTDNPTINVVYTDYREIHPDTEKNVPLPDYNPAYLRTQNPLPPTALFRRELWDNGVRFRDNTAYEDWDFWIQCAMNGAQFLHIPRILYLYYIHADNYSHYAISQDGQAKAQIVINNPDFFHPLIKEWAEDLSRGRLYSQPFRRGYIPTPNDIRQLLHLATKTASKQP